MPATKVFSNGCRIIKANFATYKVSTKFDVRTRANHFEVADVDEQDEPQLSMNITRFPFKYAFKADHLQEFVAMFYQNAPDRG